MNPNWTRWIHASLCVWFLSQIKEKGLYLHVEGQERRTTGLLAYAELRWDGPYADKGHGDIWNLDTEINVAVTTVWDNSDTHKHKRNVGLVQASFADNIKVYKYGDDDSYLGCLRLKADNREAIITSYFGKIAADVELEQSTVEAHYRMTLET